MLLKSESLYPSQKNKREYYDKRSKLSKKEYFALQKKSCTLYIGNLTGYTKEETVYKIFSMVGPVENVIMGLNKRAHVPCGFCFVIYYRKDDAHKAVTLLSGVKVDGNVIRVDTDIGFSEGRQFGRGFAGGQVRDEVKRSGYVSKGERI